MPKIKFTKEELEATAAHANRQLQKLREEEKYEANKQLVGKCFRTRNNYSCPKKPSDYWWLYCRVISVQKDGYLEVVRFQIDKDGTIIETGVYNYYTHLKDWQPISLSVYKNAFGDVQRRLRELAIMEAKRA